MNRPASQQTSDREDDQAHFCDTGVRAKAPPLLVPFPGAGRYALSRYEGKGIGLYLQETATLPFRNDSFPSVRVPMESPITFKADFGAHRRAGVRGGGGDLQLRMVVRFTHSPAGPVSVAHAHGRQRATHEVWDVRDEPGGTRCHGHGESLRDAPSHLREGAWTWASGAATAPVG